VDARGQGGPATSRRCSRSGTAHRRDGLSRSATASGRLPSWGDAARKSRAVEAARAMMGAEHEDHHDRHRDDARDAATADRRSGPRRSSAKQPETSLTPRRPRQPRVRGARHTPAPRRSAHQTARQTAPGARHRSSVARHLTQSGPADPPRDATRGHLTDCRKLAVSLGVDSQMLAARRVPSCVQVTLWPS